MVVEGAQRRGLTINQTSDVQLVFDFLLRLSPRTGQGRNHRRRRMAQKKIRAPASDLDESYIDTFSKEFGVTSR
jgi:hypothetical protein